MVNWVTVLLVAAAATAAIVESRAIPAEPVSLMMDAYGNPVLFVREKRAPVQPYPQRAMMFTGYYRPVRRSNNGGQATGVFAQGNAVSGEAFFGGMHTPHLKDGPEPVDEPVDVSSAEAHAAPEQPGEPVEEEEENQQPSNNNGYVPQDNNGNNHHHHDQEEQGNDGVRNEEHRPQENEQPHQPEQDQEDQEPGKVEPEVPLIPADEAPALTTEASAPTNRPNKSNSGKKHKKIPVQVDDDDDDEDELEDDNDEPVVPFVPFNKGNRRRQGYPNLNNFFPMVFSFPGVSTRAGSSGSPPGAITAIANSYSTGKGGVASSVATAYGGSPNGKKRRTPPPTTEE